TSPGTGEITAAPREGRPDYLRQLAMSKLEQGRRDEARRILERLKDEAADSASLEFEAGVLALAGMREEAIRAYRRSLTKHPERIDTHLLLSNVMKELGRHQRSAGMFQPLAATADRDDLFTIAIDGILNMRDGRANRGAPDRLVEWARRVTLERLARRPDRLYLYRLVADLSDELKDKETAIRALKAALPVAGEQRTQLLRELMAMAKASSGLPAGVIIIGAPARARENERNTEELMFGRRLLGQRELVPPQVYLELGRPSWPRERWGTRRGPSSRRVDCRSSPRCSARSPGPSSSHATRRRRCASTNASSLWRGATSGSSPRWGSSRSSSAAMRSPRGSTGAASSCSWPGAPSRRRPFARTRIRRRRSRAHSTARATSTSSRATTSGFSRASWRRHPE
ncbi:MAG: tetratricopeptide repeat protein, partial [Planctomycetota bacterium]